ncbi:HAD family hydrolase [Neisseria perflava]|uniref:histidinol-phosphatase n=1 Tax=Neisseria perflava TaxID=33053 RepID=UPI0020A13780|nr:HAD family hydrolase [Neisseria perflava]MCP1659655.1 HAD superfamily hydrolase (TIGR01490 family) [Neisseria perflava]MCP1771325.1 HAD superfamily hydrolase (TIGR01490 family) [Neisseria perflava]
MKNLAIFDLDNTLINTDSDHSWPQYLMKKGLVDVAYTEAQNEKFYQDYRNGCLNIDEFLKFHLAPLTRYSMEELADMHREFMAEFITPHITPMQRMLVQSHQAAGDELLVISSTNEFIITPICREFGIENVIGTQLEIGADGRYTGNYIGTPSLKEGKITRLNQWLAARGESFDDYDKVYFYSDSKNDLPLLHYVNEPVAVNPDEELAAEAAVKGWPVLNFKF